MKFNLAPNNQYQHIHRLFSAINQIKGANQLKAQSLGQKDDEHQHKNQALMSLFENYVKQETVRTQNSPQYTPGKLNAANYSQNQPNALAELLDKPQVKRSLQGMIESKNRNVGDHIERAFKSEK